jgi:tRNA(Ile)-lysidine synthetase-like protein
VSSEPRAHALDIIRTRLENDPRPFVLGVSGGVDSMALLYLCARRAAPTLAVHVHHGLRPSADDDARLVVDTCARLGVLVRVVRLQGDRLRTSPFGIESAARTARYEHLEQEAIALKGLILTAHHANDRLETFLLRLGQGSGVTGLAGPELHTRWGEAQVWRPLLHVWKSEILTWATAHDVPWVHDEMNDDMAFDRVKVRIGVVPAILQHLPAEPLLRSLRQVAEDATLLRALVARELQAVTLQHGSEQLHLDRTRLRELPEELCRAVVHQALVHVLDRGDRRARPEARWVFEVVRQIRQPGPSIAMGRRVRCEILRDMVKIGYTVDPRAALSTSDDRGAK